MVDAQRKAEIQGLLNAMCYARLMGKCKIFILSDSKSVTDSLLHYPNYHVSWDNRFLFLYLYDVFSGINITLKWVPGESIYPARLLVQRVKWINNHLKVPFVFCSPSS